MGRSGESLKKCGEIWGEKSGYSGTMGRSGDFMHIFGKKFVLSKNI